MDETEGRNTENDFILSDQSTLFCFILNKKIIEENLIFFYFMEQFTQRANGVKTDACEILIFFLNGLKNQYLNNIIDKFFLIVLEFLSLFYYRMFNHQ